MDVFRTENNCLKFHYDAEELWIQPWGANSFRIRATKLAEMPKENWALDMPVEDIVPKIQIEEKRASIINGKIKAVISSYGKLTIYNSKDEILLDEPEVIRHGNKYGVKMKAQAPSVNLIRAQIETEIAPIVGSEQQAKDLIAYINSSSKDNEEGIWDANIFGKSVEQIVEDGIQAKISQMTDECQQKLQDTLQKIINDSNGGLICIII